MAILVLDWMYSGYIITLSPGPFPAIENGPGDEARYISLVSRLSLSFSHFFGTYKIYTGEKVRDAEGEPGNKANNYCYRLEILSTISFVSILMHRWSLCYQA